MQDYFLLLMIHKVLLGSDDSGLYMSAYDALKQIIPEGRTAIVLIKGLGWCPDCPQAVEAFEMLEKTYPLGLVESELGFYQVHVESKEEMRGALEDYLTSDLEKTTRLPFTLQVVPTFALYVGVPSQDKAIVLDWAALPDSNDPKVHLDRMMSVIDDYL